MRRAATSLLLAATCVAAAGSGCGGSTAVTDITGPDAQRCDTRVATPPSTVPSGGSRLTLAITAGRDCIWTAAPDVHWLQVNPGSGQGDSALTVVAAANESRAARSGVVIVGSARVTIRQDAAPPPPEPPPPPESSPGPGPSSPGPGPSSPGPGPAPNPGPTPSPAPSPAPPAPPTPPAPTPPCTFELTADRQSFGADGGDGRARLRTQSQCEWTASSSDSWIDVRGPRSGRGDSDLDFRVDRNGSSQSRSGTISAGGRSLRIDQAGAQAPPAAPSCTFDISPDKRRVDADGGDEHFNVDTSSGCSWSGSTNVSWINLVKSSGSGKGRIEYRVQPNTSTQDRSGSISVGGRTHEVEQRGAKR